MSLYSQLLLLAVLGSFLFSFLPRLQFWQNWRGLLAVWLLVGLPFIIWDSYMTQQGAWGFTYFYAGTTTLLGLPISEWLFFLVIPFICLLMYQLLATLVKTKPLKKLPTSSQFLSSFQILLLTALFCGLLGFVAAGLYTASTLWAFAIVLLVTAKFDHHLFSEKPVWVYFLVSFAGFLVINSILTALPIVYYSPAAILGIRIGTIPIEDFVYNAALLLGSLVVWRYFDRKAPLTQNEGLKLSLRRGRRA